MHRSVIRLKLPCTCSQSVYRHLIVFGHVKHCKKEKKKAQVLFLCALSCQRQRRHQRVKTWTRHVDIFKKDFLFVPVNQE